MSGSERTGTTLLAALGLVLGAIALWQPVGPIADSPGQRLVLDVPAWVQFVLLGATLVEFLAIVLVMIPNRLKKRPDGTLQKRPSAMRLSPIEKMALLLPFAAVAIAAYQSQYFESGWFGWLFGAGSRGGWFGSSSADPPPDVVSVPLLDLSVSITLSLVAAVVIACSILAILLVRPWVTIAEWLRQARVRRGASPVEDMTSALAAGRRALEIGDDPRTAVIACYRQCEAALASRRRGRHAAETPREFLRGALAALHLPAQPIRALLQVFERARFSDLPVTRLDRSVALGALDEIRTDLERRREDGAQP
jgi:membrane protein implicated in regulation of membrane protease activity